MVSLKNKINYKNFAKEVVAKEIESLKKLKYSINESFNNAVKAIINCKGKCVTSGIGKSGIIASKIASSLSSVGTPSFYLNAASCAHGDIGAITSNDVLILISNSGDTNELKPLIQYASRNKKITLIGITSRKESLLYKNSNIKILYPNSKEADPYNIVPTSSTTTQLVIGDALCLSTMKQRKFGRIEFRKFHSGGHLGQKLKTVEDLMIKKNKLPIVQENRTMTESLKILNNKKLGVVIVIKKGKTVGILVDGDIKRASQKNKDLHRVKIKKIMTKKPISVDKNMLAAEALSIMNSKKVTCLCVHQKKLKTKTIGLIHVHHILNSNIN